NWAVAMVASECVKGMLRYNHPREVQNFVLRGAKNGDWGLLALYIEIGGAVTPAMRNFLTAVLRGENKRPNNRAMKFETEVLSNMRAVSPLARMRDGENSKTRAIEKTAETYSVDVRTVQRDKAKLSGGPMPQMAEYRDQILRSAKQIADQRYLISPV